MIRDAAQQAKKRHRAFTTVLIRSMAFVMFLLPFCAVAQSPEISELPDSIPIDRYVDNRYEVVGDRVAFTDDSLMILSADTVAIADEQIREFNPDPNRAVWLSALCPGLGQIYNRRYWKLPIVVGGFMGLAYATSWNNTMLTDYNRAYRDLMDSDPTTNSYMNIFPSNTPESSIDKTWLENILKSRKNYFRRNRDLCIICIVGVYLVAMVDAYVDASLSHFDVTPDLTLHWSPTLIPDSQGRTVKPSIGLQWAFTF